MTVYIIYYRETLYGIYATFDKAMEHYETLDRDMATYPIAVHVIE